MDENASGGDSDDIDWNTDDELEIASYGLPSCSSMTVNDGETIAGSTEHCQGTIPVLLPNFQWQAHQQVPLAQR